MRRDADPSWHDYPNTILEFFRDPDDGRPALCVDLRRPLADDARTALAALGLGDPFGILTAAAPLGEPQDDAFDDARQAELEEVAHVASGATTRRVDGVSPDRAHRERSVAVRLPKASVVELGRRYRQSAVFWYDGADFWLLGAVAAAEPQRLPLAAGEPSNGEPA